MLWLMFMKIKRCVNVHVGTSVFKVLFERNARPYISASIYTFVTANIHQTHSNRQSKPVPFLREWFQMGMNISSRHPCVIPTVLSIEGGLFIFVLLSGMGHIVFLETDHSRSSRERWYLVARDMVSRNLISQLAPCRFIDPSMISQKHHGSVMSSFVSACNLGKTDSPVAPLTTAAHFPLYICHHFWNPRYPNLKLKVAIGRICLACPYSVE